MLGKVDGTEGVCARFFCGHAHGREVCTAGGKEPDSPGGIVYRGAFVGTDQLIQEAGADAEEAVITQVVPPYYLTDLKTVALLSPLAVEVHAQFQAEFRQPGRVCRCDGDRGGTEKSRQGANAGGWIRGIESVQSNPLWSFA